MASKSSLRESLKAERLAADPNEITHKSQAIAMQLIDSVDWVGVDALHCFMTLPELYEVETGEFLAYIWQEYPAITTYTTQKVGRDWVLGHLRPDQSFEPQTHKVPMLDVVIIPMLGFDEKLHRIGYGGGYYDQLLASQPQARRIGVCFEMGKQDALPVEPHDMPLDMIITETNTYHKPL